MRLGTRLLFEGRTLQGARTNWTTFAPPHWQVFTPPLTELNAEILLAEFAVHHRNGFVRGSIGFCEVFHIRWILIVISGLAEIRFEIRCRNCHLATMDIVGGQSTIV